MRGFVFAIMFAAAVAPGVARAQGVPVTDGTSLGQLIAQLEQMVRDGQLQSDQLNTLLQLLGTENQQKESLEAILRSLVEGTEAGKLLNDFETLQGFAEDPMAALQAIAVGQLSSALGGASAQRAQLALQSAGLSPQIMSDLSQSQSGADRNVAQGAGAAAMMSVAGQGAFDATDRSGGRLQSLIGEIDRTEGTKAAIDLNSRITAELGLILIEMWRLEAAQAVGLGQMGIADAATIAAERRFRSMSLE